MNLYSLWRKVHTEWELVRLSTERDELRQLMADDAMGMELPIAYKLSIVHVSGDLTKDGRVSAFREAAEYFDQYADTFPDYSNQRSAFRYASVKLFALMEQEIAK